MRSTLLALTMALLSTASGLADEEKGPFDISWQVTRDSIVTIRVAPGDGAPPEAKARNLEFHGFQILPRGPAAARASSFDEIGDCVALAMPPEGVRVGRTWRAAYEMPGVAGCPMFLKGGYKLIGWTEAEPKRLQFDGIFDAGSERGADRTVKKGRLASSSFVDPATGRIERATVTYDLTIRNKNGDEETVTGSWTYEWKEAIEIAVADFQGAVDAAVEKGVAFLKSKQAADGSFPGRAGHPMGNTALHLLALLKSGVPRFDPAIHKGFEYLKTCGYEKTYDVAILIMALEARHAPLQEKSADGQTIVAGAGNARIPPDDLEWMQLATRWLLATRNSSKLWRYEAGSNGYDHSVVQYAVLGLTAARRSGIAVPAEIWKDVADHFVDTQEANGPVVGLDRILEGAGGNERYGGQREYIRRAKARGWGYVGRGNPYGSMTAAGIACLVLAEAGLYESRALDRSTRNRIDLAIREGLAWMDLHYDFMTNPGKGDAWYFYYLYGVERAMILSQTRLIGEKDWYRDGAQVLLHKQAANGSWKDGLDTCFALLYLKRATVPVVISSGG